ncbi:MAG TPA: mycofactocin precursor MftA [Acidimicrobiales bacterium]|jgi:mycofactocin precursor|nr:mycofactocin precursor MftA [Acidimicrobiales bacterium]
MSSPAPTSQDSPLAGELVPLVDDEPDDELVDDDLLVSEISIDGMCGVY